MFSRRAFLTGAASLVATPAPGFAPDMSLRPLLRPRGLLRHTLPSGAELVAQAALETGWGQHIIKTASGQSSNNVFNIKAHRDWEGSSTVKSTLEYEGGVAVQKKEPFRVYDSIAQSFDDFVEFLQSNPRYQKALDVANNPAQFLDELQAAGYATDPNYSNKIKRLLGQSEFQAVAPKLLGQGE